jgi:hypothetical protein
MSHLPDPTFCSDLAHAFVIIERLPTAFLGIAQLLEITLYERDLKLYYEGLVLSDRYGDAFNRNLVTEKREQERRS